MCTTKEPSVSHFLSSSSSFFFFIFLLHVHSFFLLLSSSLLSFFFLSFSFLLLLSYFFPFFLLASHYLFLFNFLIFKGTLHRIYVEESIRGLYRGLGATMLGYLPTWAIYFTSYDFLKTFVAKSLGLDHFFRVLFLGKFLGSSFANPFL